MSFLKCIIPDGHATQQGSHCFPRSDSPASAPIRPAKNHCGLGSSHCNRHPDVAHGSCLQPASALAAARHLGSEPANIFQTQPLSPPPDTSSLCLKNKWTFKRNAPATVGSTAVQCWDNNIPKLFKSTIKYQWSQFISIIRSSSTCGVKTSTSKFTFSLKYSWDANSHFHSHKNWNTHFW